MDGGAAPQPWILDVSILAAFARSDESVIDLLQALGLTGQPLVIPALAIAGARLAVPGDQADGLLSDLASLDGVSTVPLLDDAEATALAAVMARGGLDMWDAHVALVADREVCPILTLDAPKWRQHRSDLDEPLEFIEIADPGEGA